MAQENWLLYALDSTIKLSKQLPTINQAAICLRDLLPKRHDQLLELEPVEIFFRSLLEDSYDEQESLRHIAVDALFCVIVIQYSRKILSYDNYYDTPRDLASANGIQQFMLLVFLDEQTQYLLNEYPQSFKRPSTLMVQVFNKETSQHVNIKPGSDAVKMFHLYQRGAIQLPLTRPFATNPLGHIETPQEIDTRKAKWKQFCTRHPLNTDTNCAFTPYYYRLVSCKEPSFLLRKNCFLVLIKYIVIIRDTIYTFTTQHDTSRDNPWARPAKIRETIDGKIDLLKYRDYLSDPSQFLSLIHSGVFFHDCCDPAHFYFGSSIQIELLKHLQREFYKGKLSEEDAKAACIQVWLMIKNVYLKFIADNWDKLHQLSSSQIEQMPELQLLRVFEVSQTGLLDSASYPKMVHSAKVIQRAVRCQQFFSLQRVLLRFIQGDQELPLFLAQLYMFLGSDQISRDIFRLKFPPHSELLSLTHKFPPSNPKLSRWFQENYSEKHEESSTTTTQAILSTWPLEGRLKTLRKALKEFSNKTDITHQVFIGENTETDLETYIVNSILTTGQILSSDQLQHKGAFGLLTREDIEHGDSGLVSFAKQRLNLKFEKNPITFTLNKTEEIGSVKWVDFHLIDNFIKSFIAVKPIGPTVSIPQSSQPTSPFTKIVFLTSEQKHPGMVTVRVNETTTCDLERVKTAFKQFLHEKHNNKNCKTMRHQRTQKNEKKTTLIKIAQQLIIYFMPLFTLPKSDIDLIRFYNNFLNRTLMRTWNTKPKVLKQFSFPTLLLSEHNYRPMLFDRLLFLITLILEKSNNKLLTRSILEKSKEQTESWLNHSILRHFELNAHGSFPLNLRTVRQIEFEATNKYNLAASCCVDVQQLHAFIKAGDHSGFNQLVDKYARFFYNDNSLSTGFYLFYRLKRIFALYSRSKFFEKLTTMEDNFKKDKKICKDLSLPYGTQSMESMIDLLSEFAKNSFALMSIFLKARPDLFPIYSLPKWLKAHPCETKKIQDKLLPEPLSLS